MKRLVGILPIILLSTLLSGFLVFVLRPPCCTIDSEEYIAQADIIVHGGVLNERPIGYPLIIAAAEFIRPSFVSQIMFLLILNLLMGAGTIYFTYATALALGFERTVALLAAAIVAFFPSLINHSRYVLTEHSITFLVTAAMWLQVTKRPMIASLGWGLATITRTTTLPVALGQVFFVPKSQTKPWRERIVIVLVVCAMVWGAGELRMQRNGFRGVSQYDAQLILLAIEVEGTDFDVPSVEYLLQKYPHVHNTTEALGEYTRHFFAHPAYFVWQRVLAWWQLWGPIASSGNIYRLDEHRELPARLVIGAERFLLLVLTAIGLYWQRRNPIFWQLCLPALVITAIHTMLFGEPRYICPAVPGMAIVAAWTIRQFKWWQRP